MDPEFFFDDHFVFVAVGWYDSDTDTLTNVPPNIILGEN